MATQDPTARIDWETITVRWLKEWEERKAFEARPKPGQKKFFCTFPYPYMNSYLHLGHFYTLMRVEATARYKRMQGYNVLFPQGWHCTGSPIETAAKRIRENEQKQWNIMRDQGFSDDEIRKFSDPVHWTAHFPKHAHDDLRALGFSIDFSRSFITTSLNPHYDAFIRWQFETLRAGGYIIKGKHPVVWDPKENMPVGDHDRIEGEGETPQEFTLLKFHIPNTQEYLIAATLRPETVFGQTNLWVDAAYTYTKAQLGQETWILSSPAVAKLKEQEKDLHIIGEVTGKELLGKKAVAPMIHREIPILPSTFCTPEKGTGIVTSVPSDAPDDWMGIHDLQKNHKLAQEHGLDQNLIDAIKPIPIIKDPEYGDMAAVKLCTDMKISSQKDRQALEQAKKLVYKKGFYTGTMTDAAGQYAGMSVEKAKEAIKKKLLESNEADTMYELTGKVVSRSLTPCIVKIVSDQWFLDYSNEQWKEKVREALRTLTIHPEKARVQFENVIEWISNWACTREYGLGTKLPWDSRWVIESLSDSTIYMAYYTIAHKITKIPQSQLDNAFFDYVFLGKGTIANATLRKKADALRAEFLYWYPVDFRNSGKDLIQNHLIMYLFNHTAIFPKEHWPAGIGVNGWVMVDGKKMSKSLGNFYLLRDLPKEFGTDVSRITILSGGEDMDDPNWDGNFARSMKGRLEQWYSFIITHHHATPAKAGKKRQIDLWLESALARIIRDTTAHMEKTFYRSALQCILFELPRAIRHYAARSGSTYNQRLMNHAIETQLLMLAPFAPFYCEEAWQAIGKKKLICAGTWPEADDSAINEAIEQAEQALADSMNDITEVLRLANIIAPKRITLILADPWKYEFTVQMHGLLAQTRNMGEIMKQLGAGALHSHMSEIAKMLPRILKDPSKLAPPTLTLDIERKTLQSATDALKNIFNCEIAIIDAVSSNHAKAHAGMPGRPAVVAE